MQEGHQALMQIVEKLVVQVESLKASVDELLRQGEIREKRAAAGRKSAEVRGFLSPPSSTFVQNKKCVPNKIVKSTDPSPGTLVWTAYAAAYRKRYGLDPVRNAKVNSQCLQIAKTVGPADAQKLAAYYLSRSDSRYVMASHTLGLFLFDIQKLYTEQFKGNVVTMTDARRAELYEANDRVAAEYLSSQQQTLDIDAERERVQ